MNLGFISSVVARARCWLPNMSWAAAQQDLALPLARARNDSRAVGPQSATAEPPPTAVTSSDHASPDVPKGT